MSFCWCTINVSNMAESLKFYQEIVGLAISRRIEAGPGAEIIFLGDGETKIELMSHPKIKDISIGKDISLGFEVESLEEKYAFIREKGIDCTEIYQPNPFVKFFFVTDPNGVKVQFVQNQ